MISRWGNLLELVSLDLSSSFIDDVVRERPNSIGRLLSVEHHA